MKLKHKAWGWIYDKTRNRYDQIEMVMVGDGHLSGMYALRMVDRSFSHYLSVEELDELYPYVGTNLVAIEVLYGVKV